MKGQLFFQVLALMVVWSFDILANNHPNPVDHHDDPKIEDTQP